MDIDLKMKEIDTLELKKVQLDILRDIHSYCQGKGYKYFLAGGTLIGAVRHKGYIPWDDDIDIFMPREDYEQFVNNYNLDATSSTRVISLKNKQDYYLSYAKVEDIRTLFLEDLDSKCEMGVNVDVFPLDGVPDDEKERLLYFKRIQRLRNKEILKGVSVNWEKRNFIKNLILIGGKILLATRSLRSIAEELEQAVDKTMTQTRDVANVSSGNNGIKSCFPREAIFNDVDVLFEGEKFKTMQGYEIYLKINYGDYMQLPPEDKRISHHAFKAYWKI